jgi:hypothetical protein
MHPKEEEGCQLGISTSSGLSRPQPGGKILTEPNLCSFPLLCGPSCSELARSRSPRALPKECPNIAPPSPLECQFCQSTWHTHQLRESFLMSYKKTRELNDLYPRVFNETYRIKIQQTLCRAVCMTTWTH